MDRDKLIEEIAKTLFDWIDDEGWKWDEVDKDVRDHYRNKTDSILSLLAPVFEKAERWDAYQTDLINEKAHTERFIKLMDAEEGELRRKAEKWERVEEIAASEGCEQCVVKTPCAGASHTVCSVARGIIIILKETP